VTPTLTTGSNRHGLRGLLRWLHRCSPFFGIRMARIPVTGTPPTSMLTVIVIIAVVSRMLRRLWRFFMRSGDWCFSGRLGPRCLSD